MFSITGRRAFIVGAVIAGVLLAVYHYDAASSDLEGAERTYVADTPTDTATWKVFARGDGQTFAVLADDLTLSRPERFQPQVTALDKPGAEAAYRAQRPMLAWSTALLAFGQDALIPAALITLVVLSGGFATWAASTLSERGVLIAALPGFVAGILNVGPEVAATGAAMAGFALWPRHPRWAGALMASSVLLRESLLVIPAAMMLYELVRNRRIAWPLAWSPLLYTAWIVFVHTRVHAWPWDAGYGRLALSMTGPFAEDMSSADIAFGLLAAGLLIAGFACATGAARWVIGGHLLLLSVLGGDVWNGWHDLYRVMLPGTAFALLAIASSVGRDTEGSSVMEGRPVSGRGSRGSSATPPLRWCSGATTGP